MAAVKTRLVRFLLPLLIAASWSLPPAWADQLDTDIRLFTVLTAINLAGYDEDAEFMRVHSYVWKGKVIDWYTYRMWIIEWADYKGLDPEAQFVVNSLRERK